MSEPSHGIMIENFSRQSVPSSLTMQIKLRGQQFPTPTPAQLKIIALRATGMGQKQIAVELNLALSTVVAQLVNLYKRMGWNSAIQLTHYALAHELVDNMFTVNKKDKLSRFFEANLGRKFSTRYLRDIFGDSVAARISAINQDEQAEVTILQRPADESEGRSFYWAVER